MSPSLNLQQRSNGILTIFPFLLKFYIGLLLHKFLTIRLKLQLGPTNPKRNTLVSEPFPTSIIKINVQFYSPNNAETKRK